MVVDSQDLDKTMFSTEVSAYLRDESGMAGTAEEICFPNNLEEIQTALSLSEGKTITVQGARTGLCGGAVPCGGNILNITKMKQITGFSFDEEKNEGSITLEAGVTLGELELCLKKKRMNVSRLSEEDAKDWEAYQKSRASIWFLPNPTDADATLGGIAATDAVGSHVEAKGGTAENILSLRVVMPNGSVTDSGNDVCGTEGDAGIIAELELKLISCPKYRWGLLSFHHTYESMGNFYEEFSHCVAGMRAEIGAADWFAGSCCTLVKNADWGISFPGNAECVLWTELWGEEEDEIYEALEAALELLELEDELGEQALAATNPAEFVRLENFRHMVTEAASGNQGKKTALFGWTLEKDALLMAKSMTELLGNAEYALLGHMAYGMTTLHILDDAEQWEEPVMKLLIEKKCRSSGEYGCGKRGKSSSPLSSIPG